MSSFNTTNLHNLHTTVKVVLFDSCPGRVSSCNTENFPFFGIHQFPVHARKEELKREAESGIVLNLKRIFGPYLEASAPAVLASYSSTPKEPDESVSKRRGVSIEILPPIMQLTPAVDSLTSSGASSRPYYLLLLPGLSVEVAYSSSRLRSHAPHSSRSHAAPLLLPQ